MHLADFAYELVTLGGWELRCAEGRPVALRSRKARALLAILCAQRSLRMSRVQIASLLWADRAEPQARGSLRQALAELRRALGPAGADIVRSAGETVELDAARIASDVACFETLLAKGSRSALERTVALYRGPFLEGFDLREDAFDEWRMQEASRLEAQLLTGLERLASLCEADGDLEAALAYVDRLLEIAPLREEMHRRAMQLCRHLGRTTEALERYEHLRSRLAADLDIEPQADSQRLYAELRSARGGGSAEEAAPVASDATAPAIHDGGKPSVAVLPFVNLSGDPAQEFFADGMTEDIITELSRFRGLFVIARNSSFVYKGRAVDTREIARELGVKYVVEGSVRSGGGRLRVSAQLIEATNRSHVWAERYDREPSDLFSLQDEIVRTLVAAIEPELGDAERRIAASASAERLDAWGAYHRGMWHLYRFTKEDTQRAIELFVRAIEAVPIHTRSWIGRAFAHFSNAFLGFVEDRGAERRLCLKAARRAVELDPRDAAAHWALGRAYSLELDYDRAIPELETAVELNTNDAQSWYQLGWLRVRAGRPREAIDPLLLAERLSPNDPLRFAFLIVRAQAHFALGEYSRALALAERAAQLPHAHAQIEAVRIACLVKDGQEQEARAAMANFRADHPDFTQALFREAHGFARDEDLSPYLEALELVGLPA
jgi:TolB-like protein/Tfp pilus assembly protein PilF